MKYIRTKDGNIFTVVEKIDKTEFNHSFKYLYRIKEIEKINNSSNIIVDVNVVKDADTIEELCDEFVIVGISGIPYGTHGLLGECEKEEKNFLKQLIKTQEYEIYGAIWTDKGLIYVAKMNDKGELELL